MPAETGPSEEPTATFDNTPKLEATDAVVLPPEEDRAPVDSSTEEEQSREVLPPNNINEVVVEIQEKDGVDVGPAWWAANVKDGTEAEMLAQFLSAYERDFPRGTDGIRRKKPGAA